jgi:Fic family protein
MIRNKPFNDLPLLPPSVNLEATKILKKAITANRALAELNGLANAIPNADVLVNGIVLQEARLSSEIENIVTTSDELYRAAADEKLATDPQAKEVLCYRQALWHGFEKIKKKPLSTNLFIEIVSIIKNVDIGIRRVPGTTIANSKTKEIIYTPPEGESIIREKLANLEQFMHAEDDIDPLIKLVVMHYQFEAIHPFTDGNGRTGRIVNILFLVEKELLNKPILFLSHYILKTKSAYYEGLRNVTEKNAWEEWILYMLNAIEITAGETRNKIITILDAMEKMQKIIQTKVPKIYSKDLIEVLFQNPYCKGQFLENAGIAKRQTAANYLQTLEEIGLLQKLKKGKENYYINKKLVEILKS